MDYDAARHIDEAQEERGRGPRPETTGERIAALPAAIEEAFRAIHRIEDVETTLRKRLDAILDPEGVKEVAAKLSEPDRGQALVVAQTREIAGRVNATAGRIEELLDRLTL